jgi:hypothetical protein
VVVADDSGLDTLDHLRLVGDGDGLAEFLRPIGAVVAQHLSRLLVAEAIPWLAALARLAYGRSQCCEEGSV